MEQYNRGLSSKRLEYIEHQLRGIEGDVDIDTNILHLLNKPDIAGQFHHAVSETTKQYLKAVAAQDTNLVREYVFFISHDPTAGVSATTHLGRPTTHATPIEAQGIEEVHNEQTIALVHTHPPRQNPLTPSVIVEAPPGQYRGDLYTFLAIRRMREEDRAEGKRPSFTHRPLSIILQEDLQRETVKLLFIRENEALAQLDETAYIEQLKKNNRGIKSASSERKAQKKMLKLGFHSYVLELPKERFYQTPMLDSKQLEQINNGLVKGKYWWF